MIENIMYNDELLSVIIRSKFESSGIEFFTPGNFSQQLGYMNRAKSYVIEPHVHNAVGRVVTYTQEVLFIKKGRVRVDYYNDMREYLESKILEQGDVVLLASGGHGFKMIEDSEIIEVKQGPYVETQDKIRFEPISDNEVVIKS
jgi:hypothetical protein